VRDPRCHDRNQLNSKKEDTKMAFPAQRLSVEKKALLMKKASMGVEDGGGRLTEE